VTGRVISGWSPPQHRVLKYDDILPNLGLIFDITPRISVFANYAKGISVPSTDNLYNSFFFPEGSDAAKPEPETTNSFDGGVRYRSTKVQGATRHVDDQVQESLGSAFDPELNASVFRNLGTVDKWGVDGSGCLVADQAIHRLCVRLLDGLGDQEKHPDRPIHHDPGSRRFRTATTSRPGPWYPTSPGTAPSPPATVNQARQNIPTASPPWGRSAGRHWRYRQTHWPALHLRQQCGDV
jgi:hypothetical protein